jgi:hypothetical protein
MKSLNVEREVTSANTQTPTDRSKDVQEFTKLMIEEDIFVIKPGRKHASFPDMDLLLKCMNKCMEITRFIFCKTKAFFYM